MFVKLVDHKTGDECHQQIEQIRKENNFPEVSTSRRHPAERTVHHLTGRANDLD